MLAIVPELNVRPDYDEAINQIAEYVMNFQDTDTNVLDMARWCLIDALGCAVLALQYPECKKLVAPIVPGAILKNGARIPGTSLELEPVQASFCLGAMIRWLDYNDTFLAKEWGHPSDNLGSILMVADYLSRQGKKITMRQVLMALIKTYEIQGVLALENSLNRLGFDHVAWVRIASTAVITEMLGGDESAVQAALSQAFIDGCALRTYRHSPNTGLRKSWAAGDATSRAVRLALLTLSGEQGYPSALTVKKWGFNDTVNKGHPIHLSRRLNHYIVDNILFKINFPAEFHSQTAAEAAIKLAPLIKNKIDQIERITIRTQEPAMRILNKRGQLYNIADRDHCMQYIVAVSLLYGDLKADYYRDEIAEDPRIDTLRNKIEMFEDEKYSRDYYDADKRSIANAVQVYFRDGSCTEEIALEYPIGHKFRRQEGAKPLWEKFTSALNTQFDQAQALKIQKTVEDLNHLMQMPAAEFLNLWVKA